MQAGCTIKMSIHETSSEECFLIESKVKYMYRINPQGYQACVVEVEVEAIQIGVQHGGGREATGVWGARWRRVYTTGGRSGSAREGVQT
jgi:hypothetical protein